MKKCLGCGAVLQTIDSKKMGYIDEEVLDKAKYCQRCFKITHYNQNLIMPLPNINETLVKEINKKAKYVFFLIDFINICKETMDTYQSIKCNKVLVINKLDIIPRSIKLDKIRNSLKDIYKIDNVIFVSSKNKKNINSIYQVMNLNNIMEAYILGYTNAGKSTLINEICLSNGIVDNKITTSLIPNTTLDFIKIKINDNKMIIDSPGFTLNKSLYELTDFDLIKRIVPKEVLKPRTYQLKDNSGLIIEDKFMLYVSKKNSFTCYFSNQIVINKVFKEPLEYKVIRCHKDSDLVIKSLGFINIKEECEIKVWNIDLDLIEVRDSIFKDR